MTRFQIPRTDGPSDAWYESEPTSRSGMIVELQRIKRRTLNRPLPVIALAVLMTAAVTYRVARHAPISEAEVVIAITEESLADRAKNTMPSDELESYVTSVLMPDASLAALIEKRNLYPSRKVRGMPAAIEELREQLDVEIFRNMFLYFDDEDLVAGRSVRIGLTVTDTDPDRAFQLARDLAGVVIETSQHRMQQVADELTREVQEVRTATESRLDSTTRALIVKRVALTKALADHDNDAAARLAIEVQELGEDQRKDQAGLTKIVASRDLIADRIAAAGLDNTVRIVEERRPNRPDKQGFTLVMIAVVVGVLALLGAAIVIGAFDSRIHDGDDVERLGLPILGHVPGFPGDQVGSLRARGAVRARVPSFLRWRSHR